MSETIVVGGGGRGGGGFLLVLVIVGAVLLYVFRDKVDTFFKSIYSTITTPGRVAGQAVGGAVAATSEAVNDPGNPLYYTPGAILGRWVGGLLNPSQRVEQGAKTNGGLAKGSSGGSIGAGVNVGGVSVGGKK